MKDRRIQVALVVVGAVVVLGHLVALAIAGMTVSSWLSGTVIGLLLAVIGGAHLLLGSGSSPTGRSSWQQVGFGVVALALGVVEGFAGARLPDAGPWRLLLWIVTALAIGMLLDGPPREKAARLAAFGFSSVLVFVTVGAQPSGAADVLLALVWGLVGAAGAVGVGATAHLVMSRMHARA